MKIISTLILALTFMSVNAQLNGFYASLNAAYKTVGDKFLREANNGFYPVSVKMTNVNYTFGASGKYIFKNFAVGAGGNVGKYGSNNADIVMYNREGYMTLGYNLSSNELSPIIASLRVGFFNNNINASSAFKNGVLRFGDASLENNSKFNNQGLIIGVECDMLRLFPIIKGAIGGLSIFYNTSVQTVGWKQSASNVNEVETSIYSTYGLMLKVGFGNLTSEYSYYDY